VMPMILRTHCTQYGMQIHRVAMTTPFSTNRMTLALKRVLPGQDAEQSELLKREVMHLLSLPQHRHLMGVTSIVMAASGTIVGYMMPVAELGDLKQVTPLNSQNDVAQPWLMSVFHNSASPPLKQFWFRRMSPMASKSRRLQAKVHMPCDGHAVTHGCLDLQFCAFSSSCSAASPCCTNMTSSIWM
jgi:hypothetical protein